jgi:hypothetical protein
MDPSLYDTDPLLAIQQAGKDHILADVWFADILIILADEGDVLNKLEQALSKLKGLAITIETLSGPIGYVAGASASTDVEVGITVNENVLVNRSQAGTRKRASAVLQRLVSRFKPANNPPFMIAQWRLEQDTANACIFSLTGKVKLTLAT